jgi:hypothetical protein
MSDFLGIEMSNYGPFSIDGLSGRTGSSGGDLSSLPEASTASSNPNGSTHDQNQGNDDRMRKPSESSPATDNTSKAAGAGGVESPDHTDPTIKKAENSTVQPTGSAEP